jgi:Fe2+ transport system protein FeoA
MAEEITISAQLRSLRDSRAGSELLIVSISHELDCELRLRELGLQDGSAIRVLSCGDPFLILSGDTRLALDRELAACIEVRNA